MPDDNRILFLLATALCLASSLLFFVLRKQASLYIRLAHGLILISALAGGISALRVLTGGSGPVSGAMPGVFPGLPWQFLVDRLAALFLLIIAIGTGAACLYAPSYLALHHPGRVLPAVVLGPFVLSMALVVTAGNALTFLVSWEMMSLLSFFLVTMDHHRPPVRKAGFIYIAMTHFGSACILTAFGILYRATGTLDFAAWSAAAEQLPAAARTAVFLFTLVGFGTKAGLAPLHVWLPLAHPVAPSHVSALMSGVMVKTGIYALIRFTFDVLGAGWFQAAIPFWWGLLLLGVGVASSLLGVLYALMERDLKRVLAFSTVENVGIIAMGLGSALTLGSSGRPAAMVLALVAALYHALNHSVFKGLLFMGAGAVLVRTHTSNMERLGGLIRLMPWTSGLFLAGAAAIAALPPFSGFVSEWLVFQTLLRLGREAAAPGVSILAPVFAAGLALTGALAVACFARAFGATFLAMPRSGEVRRSSGEAPWLMRAAMAILAFLALALGIVPGLAIQTLLGAVGSQATAPPSLFSAFTLEIPGGFTAASTKLSPAGLGLLFATCAVIGLALSRVAGGRRAARVAPTWACGISLQPRMEYTATAFSKPLQLIFRSILRPQREIVTRCESAPYFATAIRYHSEITLIIREYLYRPVVHLVMELAERARALQTGSIHLYLGYILATLLILLVVSL